MKPLMLSIQIFSAALNLNAEVSHCETLFSPSVDPSSIAATSMAKFRLTIRTEKKPGEKYRLMQEYDRKLEEFARGASISVGEAGQRVEDALKLLEPEDRRKKLKAKTEWRKKNIRVQIEEKALQKWTRVKEFKKYLPDSTSESLVTPDGSKIVATNSFGDIFIFFRDGAEGEKFEAVSL